MLLLVALPALGQDFAEEPALFTRDFWIMVLLVAMLLLMPAAGAISFNKIRQWKWSGRHDHKAGGWGLFWSALAIGLTVLLIIVLRDDEPQLLCITLIFYWSLFFIFGFFSKTRFLKGFVDGLFS